MLVTRMFLAVRRVIIMRNLKNFKPHEFDCKCGCGLGIKNMDDDLLWRLDEARSSAGVPFNVTSAIRCAVHNAKSGGSGTSSHLTGHAVDIAVRDSSHRHRITESLMLAGFTRIGQGYDFIHTDNDPVKQNNVMWVYK